MQDICYLPQTFERGHWNLILDDRNTQIGYASGAYLAGTLTTQKCEDVGEGRKAKAPFRMYQCASTLCNVGYVLNGISAFSVVCKQTFKYVSKNTDVVAKFEIVVNHDNNEVGWAGPSAIEGPESGVQCIGNEATPTIAQRLDAPSASSQAAKLNSER